MGKPIAPKKGIAMAFPDVCKTPTPGGPVPIPYPNIAQLANAQQVSDNSGKQLLVKGLPVLLEGSTVAASSGDEAGTALGVRSNSITGKCEVSQASGSVFYGPDKNGIARLTDPTKQNLGAASENASGVILSAEPSVLVGD